MIRLKRALWIFSLMFLAACAGGRKTEQKPSAPAQPSAPQLPQPTPTPEANVHISVAYPVSGQTKPNVDSNFIFGSVGNGKATLLINGETVPLYSNGAFLAFLPMPSDGVYHLYAQRINDLDSATVSYAMPVSSSGSGTSNKPKVGYEALPAIAWGKVVKGSDTLQTGSDVAPGSPTPEADRRWFFPRGAVVRVIGKQAGYYKVELEKGTTAFVPDTSIQLNEKAARTPDIGGITANPGYIDIVMPADYNPFLITPEGTSLRVTVYGTNTTPVFNTTASDPMIANIGINPSGESIEYTVLLSRPVWGYKAFYQPSGALVIRLRRPPTINSGEPLRGLKIMIDPGHPPAGAIGPTGLTEAEANLSIATRVRDLLQAKGAQVMMTHTTLSGLVSSTNQSVELGARADLAVRENVDLMVSIHNNAFPDGVNPFLNYGTNTYYYHRFSSDLAQQLNNEIAPVAAIPNGGAHQKSLAICRPTWFPSALTESLFMMFPDQEQALRDPKFLDALAAAHVRGIEDFLRQRTP